MHRAKAPFPLSWCRLDRSYMRIGRVTTQGGKGPA